MGMFKKMSGILINVLTLLMRLIILALMLVWSCIPPPPKEGSEAAPEEPQPTGVGMLVGGDRERRELERRTSREEAVFGEDCYGVYEEDGDYIGGISEDVSERGEGGGLGGAEGNGP